MSNRTRILACLLVLAAACGDDGNNNSGGDGGNGDGGGGSCATATLTISTYPGMVSGTILGKGKNRTVAEMGCTDEQDYFEPTGDDTVVALTGLTVGVRYGVDLTAADDLSMYVASMCPPAMGAVTGCSLFADTGLDGDGEHATFTATATEQYLVIDNAEFADLTDGAFIVDVKPMATCQPATATTECTDIDNPFCVDFNCHQCDPANPVAGFSCSAATPVCGDAASCVAGPMMCTGDDTRDTTGSGDDGPTVATMINAPTAGVPTTITGNICDAPGGFVETDWYKITLTANVSISLAFTGAGNDLDVYFLDSTGALKGSSAQNGAVQEGFLTNVAPGTYYILVDQFAPMNSTAAVPYTLTVAVPECDPAAFALPGCNMAAKPFCTSAGVCGTGPAECLLDTDGEPNDDGPAGARTLSTTALNGQICNSPEDVEKDFYKFTVTNGQGQIISLNWTPATVDLDLYIVDATGKTYGESFYMNPEVVTLTNLPAGTYYARVENFSAASTTSQAYTITGTTTALTQCTGAASCAAEYKTQLYRGSCNTATDVCSSIVGAGAVAQGSACDSTDDCNAGRCSVVPFESDADKSICGPMACTTDAQCTPVNANLRCTTGFATNFCQPLCATDLNCGAQVSSATVDVGQPWNYFVCTIATGSCGPQ